MVWQLTGFNFLQNHPFAICFWSHFFNYTANKEKDNINYQIKVIILQKVLCVSIRKISKLGKGKDSWMNNLVGNVITNCQVLLDLR